MKFHFKHIILLFLATLSLVKIQSQTVINTSFESTDGYSVGSVNNKNNWKVTSGNAEIVTQSDYINEGNQALRIFSNTTALQIDHIAYASNTKALAGDVYLDFQIKLKNIPQTSLSITGYDLETNTHRSFMLDFLTSGKIKVYDGSSGWTTQPTYSIDTWTRISIKIDNGGAKYQIAINGVILDKVFAFREIKNNATQFDYHAIRFSMGSGTSDIAIDNMYIGSTPITDIIFQESSTERSISVTQPSYGIITLDPSKNSYQINDQVTAFISVPEHYTFTGWTGDLSGTENPKTFIVDKNISLGATVIIDTQNPPDQSTINVNQPIGGTIILQPQQTTYYNGTTVTAQLSIQSGYQFNGWTGSLSGSTNPVTFVVNENMIISANISEVQTPSTTHTVSTATQFKDALAAMNPGDTILVMDGNYNLGGVKVARGGSATKPIIIKSKKLHGAIIIGASTFTLSNQSYVTYEGFYFNLEPVSTIFKMEGCSNIRITRNWMKMKTLTSTQTSKWITVGDIWENEICNSHDNRIDHNLLEGKYDQGAWIIIDGSHGTIPAISQHDRIDHNIFRDNTPRVANEKETIRIGVSDLCKLDAFTVVENNLFEDCDGDPEIVSVKSCKDTIRNNTFRRCLGTICLRQGNNSVVESNFIFGDGKTATYESNLIGCGGVRVYGLNHRIINNYFEGLTGNKWDAACTLTNGDVTNTSTSNSSHFLPENTVFAFNTLVNNKSNIEIGFENSGQYSLAPKNCTIANNIVIGTENPFIKSFSTTSLAGVSFNNNIMFPTETASLGLSGINDSQIKNTDPKLVKTSCRAYGQNCEQQTPYEIYKLNSGSPAINASLGYESVIKDFEGQPAIGIRDIGADEYNSTSEIVNGPWDDQYVGPTAAELFKYEKSTTAVSSPIAENNLKVSQNPFMESTQLSISVNTATKITIALYNACGQEIQKIQQRAEPGISTIEIKCSTKGVLLCVIDFSGERHCIKLVSK